MKRVEKALFRCSGSHKGGSRGYCTYALPQRLCHRWWPPPWCALTRNDGLRPFLSSLALHAHRRPPALRAEHGVLRRGGSVQAMASRRAHVLQVPLARPCASDRREKMAMPLSRSVPVSSSATADTYTPCAEPTGVWESKTTMLTSGRTARLREWVASGDETQ